MPRIADQERHPDESFGITWLGLTRLAGSATVRTV